MTRNHVDNKTYSYEKDGTVLSFTLRSDTKNQMKNFMELLEAAIKEVGEDLAALG